jgi:hypothetical protein
MSRRTSAITSPSLWSLIWNGHDLMIRLASGHELTGPS